MAEEGTYEALSTNKGGAFTKLMEWQLSGGEGDGEEAKRATQSLRHDFGPEITEREEIEANLEGREEHGERERAEAGTDEVVGEAARPKEAVVERTKPTDR